MTKEDVDEAIKDFEDMKKGIFPWDCTELCDIAISALKGEAFNEKSYKDGFNDGYSQGKEKAETKAYFDGQAYGWEQGRKALIEDIKAEIGKQRDKVLYVAEGLDVALGILDNIGKGE